jgi:hypothetical protein
VRRQIQPYFVLLGLVISLGQARAQENEGKDQHSEH